MPWATIGMGIAFVLALLCQQYSILGIISIIVTSVTMAVAIIGTAIFYRCPRCGAPLEVVIFFNDLKACSFCGAKMKDGEFIDEHKHKKL